MGHFPTSTKHLACLKPGVGGGREVIGKGKKRLEKATGSVFLREVLRTESPWIARVARGIPKYE